jgi:cytoskeletal protein RodZ
MTELALVILLVIIVSTGINNLTEIFYWKYQDWRNKDEGG